MIETKQKVVPVMTIAGSDSSGGAGLQADLKTFQHFHLHGLTAVTCIVSETANTVRRIDRVEPSMMEDQILLMLEAFPLTVVKTGMLGSAEHTRLVAEIFRKRPEIKLVVDPVMVASTGASLLEPDAVETYLPTSFHWPTSSLPTSLRRPFFSVSPSKPQQRWRRLR